MFGLASIIIPVYNGSHYLDSLMLMLEKQTYSKIEVLIIDDGSSDNTWQKLTTYTSRNFNLRIFKQKENKGVSAARNKGIENAAGTFLFFIDADDLIENDYVYKMIKIICEKNVQFLTCGYTEFSGGQDTFVRSECSVSSDLNQAMSLVLKHHGICSALWNKVFLSSVVQRNDLKFDESIYIGEDMLFIALYLSNVESWCEIADVLYHYRINNDGVMQNYKISNEFNKNWISEWKAVNIAEAKVLKSTSKFNSDVFLHKKMKITLKLVGRIKKYNYYTKDSKEIIKYLRKNILLLLTNRSFSFKEKVKALFLYL
ncbi:glycosyltransferase family 2 protein [Companilactobacillus suantsaicola]|uniref:glycosyltransferase family 2 protein n=1 Tax=Companilactobacillus suantsaicola TaxID=2487723 RepID=UPI001436BB4F|nr:glycosyltransferase [Companilactobacillus suantsaicola]